MLNLTKQFKELLKKKAVMNMDIWANLPEDLIHVIAQSLPAADVCRMMVVCKSWRLKFGVLKSFDDVPKLLLPKKVPNFAREPSKDRDFLEKGGSNQLRLHLLELHGSRCCGSGFGWLIMSRDMELQNYMFNLVSREVRGLPPRRAACDHEYGNHMSLGGTSNGNVINKAILICDPIESGFLLNVAVTLANDYVAYLINYSGAESMWKCFFSKASKAVDIAYDSGVLYTITRDLKELEIWNINKNESLFGDIRARAHQVLKLETSIPTKFLRQYKHFKCYLVKVKEGMIYAVCRALHLADQPVLGKGSVIVFELKSEPYRWETVASLKSMCLFVADNTSNSFIACSK